MYSVLEEIRFGKKYESGSPFTSHYNSVETPKSGSKNGSVNPSPASGWLMDLSRTSSPTLVSQRINYPLE